MKNLDTVIEEARAKGVDIKWSLPPSAVNSGGNYEFRRNTRKRFFPPEAAQNLPKRRAISGGVSRSGNPGIGNWGELLAPVDTRTYLLVGPTTEQANVWGGGRVTFEGYIFVVGLPSGKRLAFDPYGRFSAMPPRIDLENAGHTVFPLGSWFVWPDYKCSAAGQPPYGQWLEICKQLIAAVMEILTELSDEALVKALATLEERGQKEVRSLSELLEIAAGPKPGLSPQLVEFLGFEHTAPVGEVDWTKLRATLEGEPQKNLDEESPDEKPMNSASSAAEPAETSRPPEDDLDTEYDKNLQQLRCHSAALCDLSEDDEEGQQKMTLFL